MQLERMFRNSRFGLLVGLKRMFVHPDQADLVKRKKEEEDEGGEGGGG